MSERAGGPAVAGTPAAGGAVELIAPLDAQNVRLLANVRPDMHVNPIPSGRYNLVVIGAGTAGLVAAAGAAGLGAKVALVERHLLGGDCLNVGCVPSKALIRAARAVYEVRRAEEFGVRVPPGVRVDFAAVMERLRRLRADISENDSVRRFRSLGVDVYIGHGRFVAGDTVEVDGRRLEFARAVIATGARAARPPVPGFDAIDVLTNENAFWLTQLPRRLVVLGAGPIGCELGQAFRRFGSDVTMVSLEFLPKEDPAVAAIVQERLRRDGVTLELGAAVVAARRSGSDTIVTYELKGERREVVGDRVLLGAGRLPNVEDLDLPKAEVACTGAGVLVDDRLRTSNRRVFAAGDVCSPYKFTHAADAMARIVIQNALFFGRKRASALTIPWCTYTDPEVAHVGMSAAAAAAAGFKTDVLTVELTDVDRAILDGAADGVARAILRKGTDRLLGLTIVAEHAGEMIGEVVLAMQQRIGVARFAQTIHPYPTQAEMLRKLGDAYNRTRLTPRVKNLFERFLACRR